jgi:1-aminocyclopropane-1-carboxylate deaminase/D-cysteine desulfhydrase-like pyridoxal-dependent ACC family enzyme
MQTAAAGAKLGVRAVLVLFKTYDLPPELDGNMLLDHLLGAEIRIREAAKGKIVTQDLALAEAEEAAAEFRKLGLRTYVIPVGGSKPMGDMERPLGAVAYVAAFAEMLEQTRAFGFEPEAVVHSTGSGATQAGLVVGAKVLAPGTKVVGISVSDQKASFARLVLEIVRATEADLGLEAGVREVDVIVLDEYIKDGYGVVNKDVADAIRLVFRREGIVLDPVYTAKAFVGLADLVAKGTFKKSDRVVFFHTGGTPALFPNRKKLVELSK